MPTPAPPGTTDFSYNDGLALTSAGAGVRFFLGDLQADVAVACLLSYRAPDNSSRTARLLFSLSKALCSVRRKYRPVASSLGRSVPPCNQPGLTCIKSGIA